MAIKDAFRRAMGRSSQSSSLDSSRSTSSTNLASGAQTPSTAETPQITLTKTDTASSFRLTKSLTFRRNGKPKQERQREKALEDWEKYDHREWVQPSRVTRHKSKHHQEVLRAFEVNWGGRKSRDGRSSRQNSVWSGISPGASRASSIAEGAQLERVRSADSGRKGSLAGRKRSSILGLTRVASRTDAPPVTTVVEE